MTVRADITGRYANRMYAYEPSDIKLCKCSLIASDTSFLGLSECFTTEYAIQDISLLWETIWLDNNFLMPLPALSLNSAVLSNMEKAKKFLKTEL